MRIIVHSIGSMPEGASIPLGCVLDNDRVLVGPTVVAYGEGGTFNSAGMKILAAHMYTYLAIYPPVTEDRIDSGEYEDGEPIEVRATDTHAALMWLREHYQGQFDLHVKPMAVYLGEFQS